MNRYLYGLDPADAVGSAQKLVDHGYDAVVLPAGDAAAFDAAANARLETWLCFGAHALRGSSEEEYGAQDARGNPAPWFGSACPNARAVSDRNLDDAFAFAAKQKSLAGVFVDGARFASFASTEGRNSFFGCFCPRCMARMADMDIDAEKTKAGIAMLMDYLAGKDGDIPTMRAAIDDWFNFRAACVKDSMAAFTKRAHDANLKAGAFVFAPSLWWFVGQRPDSCGMLDVVAPMLYRAYPHKDGPACLSHEWAGFLALLSNTARTASDVASLLFDIAPISDDPMSGFSPAHVGLETKVVRAQLPKSVRVKPIIQTEDDALDETVRHVFDAGADGCGEFMYAQKKF
ncbi:MAG: hypothetical protein ACOYI5_10890 [Christensenellales bacterium]|jgi:hypothetical protein